MSEPLDLEPIKARVDAAKKVASEREPWDSDLKRVGYYHGGQWFTIATVNSWQGGTTDEAVAAFIAHARSDVPALVAEVKRLRGDAAWVLEQALGDGDRPYGDDLPEAMDQLARLVPAKVRRSCALDEATAISQDLGLYGPDEERKLER